MGGDGLGLDDRDYMRRRSRRTLDQLLQDVDRQRPFTPPSQQPSLIVMVGWWVGAAFLLYKAYGWWTEHRRPPPFQPATHRSVQVDTREDQARPHAPDPRAVSSLPQVAYAPAPAAPVVEAPAPRTGGTIYLCRDYSGGSFWASDHCNRHNALIDRMVSVPEGMPFQQQVQIAEQRRQILLGSAPPVQTTSSHVPAPSPSNKSLCESLDARVTQLDAMARQPQTGPTQDWIRLERQKSRDEQFRLRC